MFNKKKGNFYDKQKWVITSERVKEFMCILPLNEEGMKINCANFVCRQNVNICDVLKENFFDNKQEYFSEFLTQLKIELNNEPVKLLEIVFCRDNEC
jgi:hypothetical protein